MATRNKKSKGARKGVAGEAEATGRGQVNLDLARGDALWARYNRFRAIAVPAKGGEGVKGRVWWQKWLLAQRASCFWTAVVAVAGEDELQRLHRRLEGYEEYLSNGVTEAEAVRWLRGLDLTVAVYNVYTGTVDVVSGDREGLGYSILQVPITDDGHYAPHWLPATRLRLKQEMRMSEQQLRAILGGWRQDPDVGAGMTKMLEAHVESLHPIVREVPVVEHGLELIEPEPLADRTEREARTAAHERTGKRKERRQDRRNQAELLELMLEEEVYRKSITSMEIAMFEARCDDFFTQKADWVLQVAQFVKKDAWWRKPAEVHGVEAPPEAPGAFWYRHNTESAVQGVVRREGDQPSLLRRVAWFLSGWGKRTMLEARPELVNAGLPIVNGSVLYSTDLGGPVVRPHRQAGGSVPVESVCQLTTNWGSTYEVREKRVVESAHFGAVLQHHVGVLHRVHTPPSLRIAKMLCPWMRETTTAMYLKPRLRDFGSRELNAIPTREGRLRAAFLMLREKHDDKHIAVLSDVRQSMMADEGKDVDDYLRALAQVMDVSALLSGVRPEMVRAFSYA